MSSLPEEIFRLIRYLPEGSLLSARNRLHLGSHRAVNQALSQIAKDQHLLRMARGLYVAPIVSRFGRRSPAPKILIRFLTEATHEEIVLRGARSANALGLKQQMPVR